MGEQKIYASLQNILDRAVDNKKVFGTSFCICYKDFSWSGASGNMEKDSCYFIASTTKLFVTAIILQLRQKGLLNFDDRITNYVSPAFMKGLHVLNGKDYSSSVTIQHLLAHTSGISDYFQQTGSNGESLQTELMQGKDQYWTFEEAIERSKILQPKFPPGTRGKAFYSDTNFQLLGHIVEKITGNSISDNLDRNIISPLGLTQTYLYKDIADVRPKTFYYKNRELSIPRAMTSFSSDGGIVSTSNDMMVFLKAFFGGGLFPVSYLSELQQWNKIFFPMRAGIGIHLFKLPWIFNPLGNLPPLIGHSGLSGALAYHNSQKDLYITGTVNQVAHPDTSFRLVLKLIQQLQ